MNKRRTIVTIIGVILSSALMMGVGMIFSSVYHNMIESIKKYNGPQEVTIKDIPYQDFHIVTHNVNVDTVRYEQFLTYGKLDGTIPRDMKPYIIIKNANSYYYDQLELASGYIPSKDDEILLPTYYNEALQTSYHIGDKITIIEGKRIVDNKEITTEQEIDIKNDTFLATGEKTYTIVGFYKRNIFEEYSSPAYSFFTKTDFAKHDHITSYITYESHDRIHAKTEKIARELKKEKRDYGYEDVVYNEQLLSLYGQSKYENYNTMVTFIIVIILSLISIACIIVIYNSFHISVMERKKQFGLFSSIGATSKQLRYTVFYEAMIVAIIGIPIGVIGGYIGIDIVIRIINILLPNMMDPKLTLAIYPNFVIIPLCFMILVIFLSAYLPARKASKVTPIEAIRQNDDIKLTGKKVKTNRLVKTLFGVEGSVALKNIKRNKKKYRITVVSLFISIVLFISFSGILKYGLYGSEAVLETTEYDAMVYLSGQEEEKLKAISTQLRTLLGVDESSVMTSTNIQIPALKKEDYHKNYYQTFQKEIEERKDELYQHIVIYKLSDEDYKNYQKKIGLKEERPILIHQAKQIYQDHKGNRKTYIGPILNADHFKSMYLYYNMVDMGEKKGMEVTNIYETTVFPLGIEATASYGQISLILPSDIYDHFVYEGDNNTIRAYEPAAKYYEVYFKLKDAKYLENKIKEIEESGEIKGIDYYNVIEVQKMERNMILVIKILLYGFITLVTLIGITSVFNTISTSLALRKKEFAMLRSIGLTPKGFQKILWFESLFFVLKALCYSLPVSFLILYLVHRTMRNGMNVPNMLLPYEAIVISIIFSFFIVLLTTIYSTRKMRCENILDAIREENI